MNSKNKIVNRLGLDRGEIYNIKTNYENDLCEVSFNTEYLYYEVYVDNISDEIVGINTLPTRG